MLIAYAGTMCKPFAVSLQPDRASGAVHVVGSCDATFPFRCSVPEKDFNFRETNGRVPFWRFWAWVGIQYEEGESMQDLVVSAAEIRS